MFINVKNSSDTRNIIKGMLPQLYRIYIHETFLSSTEYIFMKHFSATQNVKHEQSGTGSWPMNPITIWHGMFVQKVKIRINNAMHCTHYLMYLSYEQNILIFVIFMSHIDISI